MEIYGTWLHFFLRVAEAEKEGAVWWKHAGI